MSTSTKMMTTTTRGMGACIDRMANCASLVSLCKQKEYEPFMRDQCAKTCGLCGPPGPPPPPGGGGGGSTRPTRQRTSTSRRPGPPVPPPRPPPVPPSPPPPVPVCEDRFEACRTWVRNFFCTYTLYTLETKRRLCAKSCNLCNGAPLPVVRNGNTKKNGKNPKNTRNKG